MSRKGVPEPMFPMSGANDTMPRPEDMEDPDVAGVAEQFRSSLFPAKTGATCALSMAGANRCYTPPERVRRAFFLPLPLTNEVRNRKIPATLQIMEGRTWNAPKLSWMT